MKIPPCFRISLAAMISVFASSLHAAPAVSPNGRPAPVSKDGDFVFSLLPKSLQRSPDLDMTVFTEMTPYGRLLRTPTPDHAAYYLAYSSGFHARGGAVAGEGLPTIERMRRSLEKALAVAGYQPASVQHPPELLILYLWGSHNRMDHTMAAQFPELAARQQLERAMLVGGHAQFETTARILQFGTNLTDHTPQFDFLSEQTRDDLYYVAASAYDYAAAAHKERKLVWRTTMTVNSAGVAMDESLPPLISTAGPFFGRETAEPQIIQRPFSRWDVRVGEPAVIETDVPLGASHTPAAGAAGPGRTR